MNNNLNETISDTAPDSDVIPNSPPNLHLPEIASEPNRQAMISFVSSILCLFALWVVPVVGVVLSGIALVSGLKARKEMRATPANGSRLAITGLICGCLSFILSFLWTIVSTCLILGLAF